MSYIIKDYLDNLRITGLNNFKLNDIFECGQAFRWEKTKENTYIVVAFSKVIELKEDNGDIIVYNSSKEDFEKYWHNFFDLDTDYTVLKHGLEFTKAYNINNSLMEAIHFGEGIRILNQEEFEIIISFIISANNQIPRIKKSIRLLSETYGEFIEEYKGKKYYAFPTPEVLSKANPLEVKEICRVGFRNERIVESSKIYLDNFNLFENSLDDQVLGDNLLSMPGIGPKVRDCILLFGYHRLKTFPVDVWVKRLMETLYIHETIPNKKILEYAIDLFGDLRGLAQQYLFYYARENKIGK